MKILGRIIKKGSFDDGGFPIGWAIEIPQGSDGPSGACLMVDRNGAVTVNGVEIVEWTEERKHLLRGDKWK